MNDLRMWWFHARNFARTGYFVQLLFTSTLGMVALQALAARASDAAGPGTDGYGLGWLRAGMLGTWTMCSVATGMLGFQRFQGTLVHLMRTPHSAFRVLMPVVGAAATFGLLALPLALGFSWLLRQPITFGALGPTLLAVLVFWLACLSISAVIGMLFALTPNAIMYQELVIVPMVLVSGVFGTPAWLPSWLTTLARVLPTRSAVELLQQVTAGHTVSWLLVAEALGGTVLWLVIAVWAAGLISRRATAAGSLEVV